MNSTQCDPMQNAADSSKAVILPPIAWALAVVTGVGLDWLRLVPLVAPFALAPWIGGAVFATGLALAIWSRTTLGKVGTPMESGKPTTAVAMSGPYGFSRNPIYVGMLLGQTGLAIGLNNAWLLVTMAPFYLVIRYGVIAREEAYLERKFGPSYLAYKARVRRWI